MRDIVDLTLTIHEGMLTTPVPWHPPVEITILGRHELEGRATRRVTLGTHTGTHMDAPYHFVPGGATIDQIPLDVLVNRAVVFHLPREPYGKITAEDLSESGVEVRPGCGVLIHTGWDRQWMTRAYYESWPHLTMDACEYLSAKQITLLGLDTPSPDDPKEKIAFGEVSPHHYHLLSRGIVLVEFLTGLDGLRSSEVELIATPLKVEGADGFPARVLAIQSE